MTRSDVSKGWRRRASSMFRAAIGLFGAFAVGNVLHACVIEERPFDEQLATCKHYCDLVMSKCTDANAVYSSFETCEAVCDQMAPGTQADSGIGRNTLACRLSRLETGFEVGFCPQVGPGGDGVCGSDCDAFCSMRQAACGKLQPEEPEFKFPGLCERACPGLAYDPDFKVSAQAGSDTIQCRLAQLSEAFVSSDGAEASCNESRLVPPAGGGIHCWDGDDTKPEDDCRVYCDLVMQSCTDKNQVYESRDQCQVVCMTMQDGVPGDTSENTVRCRRYHAYAAMSNPQEHCAHAGPTGDGHCGGTTDGNCESYCRILNAACPARFVEAYGTNVPSCVESCARPADGDESRPALVDAWRGGFSDYPPPLPGPRYAVPGRNAQNEPPSGSTLKCRTFHAVQALEKQARTPRIDNSDDCRAAFADPGSVCE
jgi:hypothetical protein